MVDKRLLDILACPVCRGDIQYLEERQKIKCLSCKRLYPVKDGIPVMLEEEAEVEKDNA